jgi:hypothetical protein
MGEQRLHHALAPIDLLTRLELEQTLDTRFDAFTRDFYRGKSFIEINGNGNGVLTQITIPGPDSGYSWSLRMLSVNIAGTAQAFVVACAGDTITTSAAFASGLTGGFAFPSLNYNGVIFPFSSNQVIIKDQRSVTIAAALAGSGAIITNYKLIAQQVPTEMEGKL